ncbi:alkaline phosphatase [Caerostris extrusa]|uniref:alkaline phosphatase n=1 Tax=Caerostris extrusa TaxID=172846 RepID=A0AAV4W785_CAEEX|nr:alkaline phosphatase [Caerostris extrusa]
MNLVFSWTNTFLSSSVMVISTEPLIMCVTGTTMVASREEVRLDELKRECCLRDDVEHVSASWPSDRWYWYQQAKSTLLKNLDDDRNYNVAKNLILFIGDGMGMTTVTTARILRDRRVDTREENELAFDKFEYVALAKVRVQFIC